MTGADAWRTPAVRQADADLEAAVQRSVKASQRLRQSPDFQQRLENVESYARSRAAPRVLSALQRRIDSGELSWQAIAAGKHLDDPDVRAVLAAGISEPVPFDDDPEDEPRVGYAFMHFDPDAAD